MNDPEQVSPGEQAPPDDYKRGRAYVLYLLGLRDYSRAQLEKKLKEKNYAVAVANRILETLENDGLFLPERYAQARTRQLLKRGWGPSLVKAKLKSERCSVEPAQIEEAYRTIGSDAETEIRLLAKKALRKYSRTTNDRRELRLKAGKAIAAKGHSYSLYSRILDEELQEHFALADQARIIP